MNLVNRKTDIFWQNRIKDAKKKYGKEKYVGYPILQCRAVVPKRGGIWPVGGIEMAPAIFSTKDTKDNSNIFWARNVFILN